MLARSAILAALLAGAAFASVSNASDNGPTIRRVPVEPPSLLEEGRLSPLRAPRTRGARRACIKTDRIASAVVTDERSVELTLMNGERWLMRFAKDCPALSYYEGFYYRHTSAGRLCAGRDVVIARSGGECRVAMLSRMRSGRPSR